MPESVKNGSPSGTLQTVVPIVDEVDARNILAMLEKSGPWLSIPAQLKPAYFVWRHRDLRRYIRIGGPPLWALVMVLAFIGYRQYEGQFQGGDAEVWLSGAYFVCTILSVGVLLVQLPFVQRHYVFLVSPCAALVIAKYVAMPHLLITPGVIFDESFFCVIALIVATLGMRLTWLQALCTVLVGGALGLLFAITYAPVAIDWRGLGNYYVVSCLFTLFLAWQLEEGEKRGYLQAVLIARGARDHERLNLELEQLNLELMRLAHQDGLSGLPNRREFDRRLTTEWERLRREQKPLALLFIDIDNFKAFNDHYGHAAGDECLATIGRTIGTALLRPADLVSRYGGEEFVVILPDTDLPGAMDVARRVSLAVDALAIPHVASDAATHATVSIGVASAVPDAASGSEDLLRAADQAMYAAKHAGRHTIRSQ